MPQPTSDFQNFLDYQEACIGSSKGPVLFGHCPHLAPYYQDIDTYAEASAFYGRVLYPERVARAADGSQWTYEKKSSILGRHY